MKSGSRSAVPGEAGLTGYIDFFPGVLTYLHVCDNDPVSSPSFVLITPSQASSMLPSLPLLECVCLLHVDGPSSLSVHSENLMHVLHADDCLPNLVFPLCFFSSMMVNIF